MRARRKNNGLKRLALQGAGGVLVLSFFVAADGHAEPAVNRSMQALVTFSIPAQPLSTALMTLGKQANVQILTASDSIAGLRCDGASGTLTVQAALAKLLAGTNLEYETFDAQTVVVRQRSFVPALSFESQLLGAEPSIPIVTSLSAIRVPGVALGDLGYKADTTRGATRTDTSLADIPQSVSIVTRDLIDSQQAIRNRQFLRFADLAGGRHDVVAEAEEAGNEAGANALRGAGHDDGTGGFHAESRMGEIWMRSLRRPRLPD